MEPKTIKKELQRISGNIENAYTSLASKGATIPTLNADKNSNNLSKTINSLVGTNVTFDPDTGIMRIVTC